MNSMTAMANPTMIPATRPEWKQEKNVKNVLNDKIECLELALRHLGWYGINEKGKHDVKL